MPCDSSKRRGSGARYDSEALVATTLTRQPAFASISQVVLSETAAPLAVSMGDCGMSNSKLRSCIPGLCAINARSKFAVTSAANTPEHQSRQHLLYPLLLVI